MTTPPLGLDWTFWGALALVPAFLFAVVWVPPRRPGSPSTLVWLARRWSHALVWTLLAVSFFMRGGALPGGKKVADGTDLAALVIYLAFLAFVIRG